MREAVDLLRRPAVRYLLIGVLFGALFPLSATLLDLWVQGAPLSLDAALAAQARQPLHWMIDSAPIFLGLFAMLAGHRQGQVEGLNADLLRRNALLDQTVRQLERAEELAHLNAENAQLYATTRAQLEQLHALNHALTQSAATIQSLAAPLIRVRHDMLVVPLIGALDLDRITLLRRTLLEGVERTHTRIVILECTGIALIDREGAHALAQVADAIRLLGAATLLAGVSPAIAEQLAQTALGGSDVQAARDLEACIALAEGEGARH